MAAPSIPQPFCRRGESFAMQFRRSVANCIALAASFGALAVTSIVVAQERSISRQVARQTLQACPTCQGCGCRGGPGYRASDGGCVGHKQLKQICGEPPTARCTAEIVGSTKPRCAGSNPEGNSKNFKRFRCGERGGPGYRAPNGKCATRANVKKLCGDPPTVRCKAECVGRTCRLEM